MSHVRVSSRETLSPQIPEGRAHLVIALEPVETFRILQRYGNPSVRVLVNTRPVYPAAVIAGEAEYPDLQTIRETMEGLAERTWFFDATEEALRMGNAIFANIIMIGALSELEDLPLDREVFTTVLARTFAEDSRGINLKAFDLGASMMRLSSRQP